MWYTRIIYLNGAYGLILTALMLPPWLTALALGESRASDAFVVSMLLGALICGACMLGFRRSDIAPRRAVGIVLPVSAYLTAAVLVGMPFYFFTGGSEAGRALGQGMALITTSGGDYYAGTVSATSFYVWRAICAWVGGFAAIIMVLAIYTQLNHGGVSLHRSPLVFGEGRPGMSRLRSLSLALLPLYVFITLLIIFALAANDIPLAHASLFAAAAISGTGLSLGDMQLFEQSGAVLTLALAMLFAITSWDSVLARVTGRSGRRRIDPEIISLLILFTAASLVVFLMIRATGGRLDQALFLVASALSGTGWIPGTIEHTEFLAFILLGLALLGGAAASPSGGIKQIRMLVMVQLGKRELDRLAYPNAVLLLRLAGRAIAQRDISAIWLLLCATGVVALAALLGLAFLGWPLDQAMYLALTSLTLSGPMMSFLSPDFAGFETLSGIESLVVGLITLIGRVEASVFLALFIGQLWRG